jgi:hypothetical protein
LESLPIDLLSLIALSIMTMLLIWFGFRNVSLARSNSGLKNRIVQLRLDITAIDDRLHQMTDAQSMLSTGDRDFIKFLSDSRDDAFLYIEKAQAAAYLSTNWAEDIRILVEASRINPTNRVSNDIEIMNNVENIKSILLDLMPQQEIPKT